MRSMKNASLEEFADEIGISRTTLFSIEKGRGCLLYTSFFQRLYITVVYADEQGAQRQSVV